MDLVVESCLGRICLRMALPLPGDRTFEISTLKKAVSNPSSGYLRKLIE